MIDVDHLPTSELRNILLAAADQGAEEPVVKVLWQLNLRAEAEGADDDERRWLDDRADVHGPWFSQILSRVRRNQLLGLDEDGFDKSGVWRGGQFPLLGLSGELEWERWAEQQSMP